MRNRLSDRLDSRFYCLPHLVWCGKNTTILPPFLPCTCRSRYPAATMRGFSLLFTTAKKGAGYAVHFNPPFNNPLQLRSLRPFPFSVPPASGCFLIILQTAFDALLCRACRLHSADKFICCFKLLPPRLRVLGRAVRKRIYPPQESTLWAHKIPKSFLKTLF